MKARHIDLNALLQVFNLVVSGLVCYAWLRQDSMPDNAYLDGTTFGLGLLLCAETQLALYVERRRRDPFVLLLALWNVLYFQLRIYTLAMLPFSVVFDRFPYEPKDSNFALGFILLANFALYAGFFAVRYRGRLRVDIGDMRARAPGAVVLLLLTAILFAYSRGAFWTPENVPRVFNFLATFLGPEVVVLMSLVFLFLFHASLPRSFTVVIAGLIAIDMLAHTLIGSRSAIMGMMQIMLVAALAVLGVIRIRRTMVIAGVLLLPVFAAVLVAAFFIATYNRVAQAGATSLDVGRALSLAAESREQLADSPLVDAILPPIAARAGYFDFSAEIIAHREHYEPLLNFAAYGRSLVDNVLTPGFDVFDQPITSNALRFIYLNLGTPSKARVAEAYHSDQLGIYGESYAFFGFAALPLLMIGAWLLKRFYVRLQDRNVFLLGVKRALVLLVFIRLIDSFGIDWIVSQMIPFVVALLLFSFLFTVRRARPPAAPSQGVLNAS